MTTARSFSAWPLRLAAFLGATGVMAGAFGAHGLRSLLTPRALNVWETAAEYQMLHAVVLLVLGIAHQSPQPWASSVFARWSLRFFAAGILVFSGSLYALALTGIGVLGAITPIGGLCLILGWLALLLAAVRPARLAPD